MHLQTLFHGCCLPGEYGALVLLELFRHRIRTLINPPHGTILPPRKACSKVEDDVDVEKLQCREDGKTK